jgi:uncharacterized iron-regulated membrane protein
MSAKIPWTFHRVLLKLHLWTGLAAAVFLLILGVTGSILIFEPEVGRLQPRPVAPRVEPGSRVLPVSELWAALEKAAPGVQFQNISIGQTPSDPYRFGVWETTAGKRTRRDYLVNPYTGEITPFAPPLPVSTRSGEFMSAVRSLHRNLWAGKTGVDIVNYSTLAGIFLGLTGVILWWPRQIWWTKAGSSWRRFNFDLHSVVGLYTFVFLIVISFTGSMIHWSAIGRWIVRVAGQERPVAGQVRSKPPVPGARRLSLDDLLSKAAALPGVATRTLATGLRPIDPVTVIRVDASDRAFVCNLDQYTGEPLLVDDPATRPWAVALTRSVVSLHIGTYFGLPGRIIACISSTAVPVMVITGFIIWWRRKLAEWRRRWRAQSGGVLTEAQRADEAEDERENLDLISPSQSAQGSPTGS